MRYVARAIIDVADQEADADKINALEMPFDLPCPIVPEIWTVEHLATRICEAFATLRKLPRVRGPKVPGNSWPQHIYEWADKLAQEELSEREKLQRRRERNVVRISPTGEDIRRMDVVLGWLSDLARVDPSSCKIIQRWAYLRTMPHRSIKEECRRAGLSHQAFYRLRDKSLAGMARQIAATPVW